MKTANHFVKTFALLSIVGLTLAACAPNEEKVQNKQTTSDKKIETLTVGTMPAPDSLPLYIAEKEGYFEKAGVKVKLQNFKSPKDRDAAISSNQLDGAITDLVAFSTYKEAKLPWKLTSQATGYFSVLTSNPDIKTMKDVKGHSVTFLKGQTPHYVFDKALQAVDLTMDDVTLQEVPQIPVRLELTQNKKVDITVLPDPFISIAKKAGLTEIAKSSDLGLNSTGIAFSDKAIKDKKAGIQAFYKAYDQAVDYINNHEVSDYQDILKDKLGYPENILKDIQMPKYEHAKQVDNTQLTEAVDWAKEQKMFTGKLDKKAFLSNILQ